MERVITSEKLHQRLRLLEIVVFLSLALNVCSGFLALRNTNHLNHVEQETGVRQ